MGWTYESCVSDFPQTTAYYIWFNCKSKNPSIDTQRSEGGEFFELTALDLFRIILIFTVSRRYYTGNQAFCEAPCTNGAASVLVYTKRSALILPPL